MNNKQRTILWVGITAVVLMALFPPTLVQMSYQSSPDVTSFREVVKYDHLFTEFNKKIHYKRLFIQWFIASIITIGALCTAKSREDSE